MNRKKMISVILSLCIFIFAPIVANAAGPSDIFLVHLKTSLKKDDAQICVAYNVIWAALESGKNVKVLVDADGVNTFKVGWGGKDSIEGYKMPGNLRQELSKQFGVPLEKTPKTYGEYLHMLRDKGAEFYINRAMLIVSKIGTPKDPLKKISEKFFKPISIKEMTRMVTEAKYYVAY